MARTIADVLRHVNIFPEDLGLTMLIEKIQVGEHVVSVIRGENGKEKVIEYGNRPSM